MTINGCTPNLTQFEEVKHMDFDAAALKHGEWRSKLRTAIARSETLDQAAISADYNCDFGKWLHGEAKSKYGHLSSYHDCVVKHASFHVETGKIAEAINAGKTTEALALLSPTSNFNQASQAVGSAIAVLKTEVGM